MVRVVPGQSPLIRYGRRLRPRIQKSDVHEFLGQRPQGLHNLRIHDQDVLGMRRLPIHGAGDDRAHRVQNLSLQWCVRADAFELLSHVCGADDHLRRPSAAVRSFCARGVDDGRVSSAPVDELLSTVCCLHEIGVQTLRLGLRLLVPGAGVRTRRRLTCQRKYQ